MRLPITNKAAHQRSGCLHDVGEQELRSSFPSNGTRMGSSRSAERIAEAKLLSPSRECRATLYPAHRRQSRRRRIPPRLLLPPWGDRRKDDPLPPRLRLQRPGRHRKSAGNHTRPDHLRRDDAGKRRLRGLRNFEKRRAHQPYSHHFADGQGGYGKPDRRAAARRGCLPGQAFPPGRTAGAVGSTDGKAAAHGRLAFQKGTK